MNDELFASKKYKRILRSVVKDFLESLALQAYEAVGIKCLMIDDLGV